MKPCGRQALKSSFLLDSSYNINFGSTNTVGSFIGNVKNMGQGYSDSTIYIMDKSNYEVFKILRPAADGSFKVAGLPASLVCVMTCLDNTKMQNALVFDQVSPK
ncbi:MAG: hypothetical protein PHW70_07480 [Acinetobacter towneri]|nr:hypothetical protein [Acinetobacter towneri]